MIINEFTICKTSVELNNMLEAQVQNINWGHYQRQLGIFFAYFQ